MTLSLILALITTRQPNMPEPPAEGLVSIYRKVDKIIGDI
jgi:hypothetical protein